MSSSIHRVVLYTRQGCHLCDDARQVLEQHRLTTVEIDIDGDPELVVKFDDCVPVVEINGKIRFRGHVDPLLLKRIVTR